MPGASYDVDVLCLGHACFDLIFGVDHHPGPDEKSRADSLVSCGGGTAANAAMTVAHLGHSVAFVGYLGDDIYGEEHLIEMRDAGVMIDGIVRGSQPTPLSAILVKPDGRRTIVNHKGATNSLAADSVELESFNAGVVLLDGHQQDLALSAAALAHRRGRPVVLDADAMNEGNLQLIHTADYVVASERFAADFSGAGDMIAALEKLNTVAPRVVVTLGERGVIWRTPEGSGRLAAYDVEAVDTTGAGDTYHGAFAAGLAAGMEWPDLLRFAGAAGALCCTKVGARLGIPSRAEVRALQTAQPEPRLTGLTH